MISFTVFNASAQMSIFRNKRKLALLGSLVLLHTIFIFYLTHKYGSGKLLQTKKSPRTMKEKSMCRHIKRERFKNSDDEEWNFILFSLIKADGEVWLTMDAMWCLSVCMCVCKCLVDSKEAVSILRYCQKHLHFLHPSNAKAYRVKWLFLKSHRQEGI